MTQLRFAVCFALLLLLVSAQSSSGQWSIIPRPHDDWQTIRTQHFHIHFSPDTASWAMAAASRMESIHSRVGGFIGYNDIEKPLNVIVMDPMGLPNGMAIPFLGSPRIVLWPNAPLDPLMLGGLENWCEIVMVHEYAHAVHLTRKPRSIAARLLSQLFPLGPLATKLPLWAVEGYAVYIESQLTGYGRVQSSLRSMVLSQLAIEGKLPEFAELNGGKQWMGGRYPYFVGSAFLEWLMEKSEDPDCLIKLWKRTSSKAGRSFDDAFEGVFQNSPENMYARFRAELTHTALEFENHLKKSGGVTEGDIWQYCEGSTGSPAVSPDGKTMAVVQNLPRKASKLLVWSLHEEAETPKDDAQNDPDDVPALPVHPAKRKELFAFTQQNGIRPLGPRWMPDGKSILFHAFRIRPNGDFRPDVYQWFPHSDRLIRLTDGASISWIDPFPNSQQAVGLKQEFGFNHLVILDLLDGTVRDLTEPSIDTVWQNPRVSPDGQTISVVRRMENRSELVFIDYATGDQSVIPSSHREVLVHPAWMPDGSGILLCSDQDGNMDILHLTFPDLERHQVTRSLSGVLSPEPVNHNGNGCYFLKPHSKGVNIHYITTDGNQNSSDDETAFPFVLPPVTVDVPPLLDITSVAEAHAYQPSRTLEYDWTSSMTHVHYQSSIQAGFRAADVLGRFHGLILGSVGTKGAAEGAAVGIGYRRWPVHIESKGFYESENPGEQRLPASVQAVHGERVAKGLDVTLSWRRFGANWHFFTEAGGAWADCEAESDEGYQRMLAGATASFTASGNHGDFQYGGSASAGCRLGRTDDDSWEQFDGRFEAFVAWKTIRMRAIFSGGETRSNPGPGDQFILGGTINPIQSDWFHANRVVLPWLPSASESGDGFRRTDLEIMFGNVSPFVIYGTEIRIHDEISHSPHRVAGGEWRADLPFIPLFRMAPTRLTAGVAYGVDGTIDTKWRGYFSVSVSL